MSHPHPRVIIVSGPSGVGKTTILDVIYAEYPEYIERIVTTTTRPPRPSEVHGAHYYFLSREDFEGAITRDEMIEYAAVHGNYYGSTLRELERIIGHGRTPVYNIDPQGMVHLRPVLQKLGYEVVTIFLLPPSIEALRDRLSHRGTEQEATIELRLANALTEMEEQDFYDHRIVNDDLRETIARVAQIINPQTQE